MTQTTTIIHGLPPPNMGWQNRMEVDVPKVREVLMCMEPADREALLKQVASEDAVASGYDAIPPQYKGDGPEEL